MMTLLTVAPKRVRRADNEVVSQRSRRFIAIVLDAPFNVRRFEDSDQDRKLAIAFDLSKVDDLALCQLGDDDPSELHLDRHRPNDLLEELGNRSRRL